MLRPAMLGALKGAVDRVFQGLQLILAKNSKRIISNTEESQMDIIIAVTDFQHTAQTQKFTIYSMPNLQIYQITNIKGCTNYKIEYKIQSNTKKMMKGVQTQKIHETIQLLFKYYHQKQQFMKQNIPIQEEIIKKVEQNAELTLEAMGSIEIVLKEERDHVLTQYQTYERSYLNSKQKFRLTDKKNPNQQFGPADWNRNMTRVLEAMSNSHIAKLTGMKNYHKVTDYCFQELSKQQMRYRSQLKHSLKQLSTAFQNIDLKQKQENKVLTKLVKESKNQKLKQSIYFLTEVKKAENCMYQEFEYFVERNKKILDLVKNVVKNQKKSSKKVKEILTHFFDKRKDIYKQSADDEKILGLLTVIEDGVQESRELYLEKTLISSTLHQKMSRVVAPEKSKIHHMMKYLSLETSQFENKYSFFAQIRALSSNLAFKNFAGVSLAQGWIITSYAPCIAYLTFDHFLAIFDTNGVLLKKIHSSSTKINKIGDNNGVVYLEQKKKGIFTDSTQEYQLKFDNSDRMQEFILFIQNQIA